MECSQRVSFVAVNCRFIGPASSLLFGARQNGHHVAALLRGDHKTVNNPLAHVKHVLYITHMSTHMIAVRIPDDLLRRLRAVSRDVYAPTQTGIVRRGIELALAEYESKRLAPAGRPKRKK